MGTNDPSAISGWLWLIRLFLFDLLDGDGGVVMSRGATALYSALARLALDPADGVSGK